MIECEAERYMVHKIFLTAIDTSKNIINLFYILTTIQSSNLTRDVLQKLFTKFINRLTSILFFLIILQI
jgi:hypothetical protein